MTFQKTFLRLNEINSIDNLLIGNDVFSNDYTFYDEDMEMSQAIIESKESTSLYNQMEKTTIVYMEQFKFSHFKLSHSRTVYNLTDLLSDLGGL